MLKPGGNNAVGTGLHQPGKKLPHDQLPLTQRPAVDLSRYDFQHFDSQRLAALCDRSVHRVACVVSSRPRADEQRDACIGGGGEAIARGRAEFADTRDGIGERVETAATCVERENREQRVGCRPPAGYGLNDHFAHNRIVHQRGGSDNFNGNRAGAERCSGSA